jgi:hypothetical protein
MLLLIVLHASHGALAGMCFFMVQQHIVVVLFSTWCKFGLRAAAWQLSSTGTEEEGDRLRAIVSQVLYMNL